MASKKLRATQSGQGDELKIDMSPMIDMVFLLLIFFIVNAALIVVKMDKRVEVPLAKFSNEQKVKLGRIVINVYNDQATADPKEPGRYKAEDGRVFETDEDMVDFIKKATERWRESQVKPRLHLRADHEVHFSFVRKVIRNAAKAGVNEVIFVSIPRRQK